MTLKKCRAILTPSHKITLVCYLVNMHFPPPHQDLRAFKVDIERAFFLLDHYATKPAYLNMRAFIIELRSEFLVWIQILLLLFALDNSQAARGNINR